MIIIAPNCEISILCCVPQCLCLGTKPVYNIEMVCFSFDWQIYASVCVFISIDNIQLSTVCGLAPAPTNGREPSLFTLRLQTGDVLDSSSNKRNKSVTMYASNSPYPFLSTWFKPNLEREKKRFSSDTTNKSKLE